MVFYRGRGARYFIRAHQVFNAIEDLLARAAAHQAGAQLELVIYNPKGRIAIRALSCESHFYGGVPGDVGASSLPDKATQPSRSFHICILMKGA